MHHLFEQRPDGVVELTSWSNQIGPDHWQLIQDNKFTGANARHALGLVLEGVPINDKLGVVWTDWSRVAGVERGEQ